MRSVLCALAVALGVQSAQADVPALTMIGYQFRPANGARFSLGYTFTLSQPIVITALGTMDFNGTSIATAGSMPVSLYYSNATAPNFGTTTDGVHFSGDPVVGVSAVVTKNDPIMAPDGSAYVSGDGFRYHVLPQPVALYATGYELMANNNGTGYATNWAGLTTVTGMTAPIKSTYSMTQPTDAIYDVNTLSGNEGFGQAFVGPNFLIAVPEPGALSLLAMASLAMIRRR